MVMDAMISPEEIVELMLSGVGFSCRAMEDVPNRVLTVASLVVDRGWSMISRDGAYYIDRGLN